MFLYLGGTYVFIPGRYLCSYYTWEVLREGLRKKIRNFLGIFPKCRTPPPPPPFGNFDHFLPIFFGKVGNFWVILRCFKGVFRAMVRITKVLGMRRPPPHVGKNSQIIPYFFSDAFPNSAHFLTCATMMRMEKGDG